MEEFMKFFEVADKWQHKADQNVRMMQTGKFIEYVINLYVVLLMFSVALFSYLYIEQINNQGSQQFQMYEVLLIVSSSLLVLTLIWQVVLPIIRLKHGNVIQGITDSLSGAGSRAMARFKERKERRMSADPDAVKKMKKATEEEEIYVPPVQEFETTYRPERMRGTGQLDPRDPSAKEKFAQHIGDQQQGELDAVQQYGDDNLDEIQGMNLDDDVESEFMYSADRYHLAKIQQDNCAPSSFTAVGTNRYKRVWQKEYNPEMTVQGTGRYVQQSMKNTSDMDQAGFGMGMSRRDMAQVKMNSTISAGWYASPKEGPSAKYTTTTSPHAQTWGAGALGQLALGNGNIGGSGGRSSYRTGTPSRGGGQLALGN